MRDRNAFDLFDGMYQLSKKKYDWYDTLSSEGQKAAAPVVIARWMAGTKDPVQIVQINEVVNPYLFSGAVDKSALFKLLSCAATGRTTRYFWLKAPGSKSKKLSVNVVKQYYDCSTREANMYMDTISNETLIEMAEELGWEQAQIKDLQKELKK